MPCKFSILCFHQLCNLKESHLLKLNESLSSLSDLLPEFVGLPKQSLEVKIQPHVRMVK